MEDKMGRVDFPGTTFPANEAMRFSSGWDREIFTPYLLVRELPTSSDLSSSFYLEKEQ
jgi:hypothetical protein